ncbi:hypothetical protein M501DRAFT_994598 [Patellaria atrata CBS 101060]|uniref:Uncharacterized protein n=1 Tax=Patellaria atrata CBS 101060 TaxID=1346257 RepID=A0A9P4VW11_9PEZI|nr:hypothetical protein M501DRAFT_994598 [Patellaria atrata CBS 101060]
MQYVNRGAEMQVSDLLQHIATAIDPHAHLPHQAQNGQDDAEESNILPRPELKIAYANVMRELSIMSITFPSAYGLPPKPPHIEIFEGLETVVSTDETLESMHDGWTHERYDQYPIGLPPSPPKFDAQLPTIDEDRDKKPEMSFCRICGYNFAICPHEDDDIEVEISQGLPALLRGPACDPYGDKCRCNVDEVASIDLELVDARLETSFISGTSEDGGDSDGTPAWVLGESSYPGIIEDRGTRGIELGVIPEWMVSETPYSYITGDDGPSGSYSDDAPEWMLSETPYSYITGNDGTNGVDLLTTPEMLSITAHDGASDVDSSLTASPSSTVEDDEASDDSLAMYKWSTAETDPSSAEQCEPCEICGHSCWCSMYPGVADDDVRYNDLDKYYNMAIVD